MDKSINQASVRALEMFGRCPDRAAHECQAGFLVGGSWKRAPRLKDAILWTLGSVDIWIQDGSLFPPRDLVVQAIDTWRRDILAGAPGPRLNSRPTPAEEVDTIAIQALSICQRAVTVLRQPEWLSKPQRLVSIKVPLQSGRASKYQVVTTLDGLVDCGGVKWGFARVTTSTVEPKDVKRDLLLDLGLRHAAVAASAALGSVVPGVLVEVIRTKVPSEPALLADGKGLSIAAIDTTRDVWEATLAKHSHLDPHDERARAYRLLATLDMRGESFAYRVEIPMPPDTIRQWADDMLDTFRVLNFCRSRAIWPRNPSSCSVPPCPFRPLCADRLPEDVALLTRTEPGWVKLPDRFERGAFVQKPTEVRCPR